MKNHFLSQTFAVSAIVILFALLFSQRGLSVLAADTDLVETASFTETPTMTVSVTATSILTVTPTITPTPNCDILDAGDFFVVGDDDLIFTITNNNSSSIFLTNSTFYWTDFYGPNMYVDYFRLGSTQYWNGDGESSPTIISSNVSFSPGSTQDWNLDFDGFGKIYGQTHTIGPFAVELTFNNNESCMVSATIPPVFGQIIHPSEGQHIKVRSQTNFEAIGWDTGIGTTNGAGIDLVHMVIINSVGTEIVNRLDTSVPFCIWGDENPCPTASDLQWESLVDGNYQMIVWARSGVTYSWSPPRVVNFTITHIAPTSTSAPTKTPKPTRTPNGTSTSTPTSLPGATNTPRPTRTPTR